MLLNLALNHSVLISNKNDTINYNASSPDELALVNGANYLGAQFIQRDDDNILTVKCEEEVLKFEMLNILGFDSTRKRMTVIVRDCQTQYIYVMCKGADSVLLPLLKDKNEPRVREAVTATFGFMEDFASNGLRTLLYVEKQIAAEDYQEWLQRYN